VSPPQRETESVIAGIPAAEVTIDVALVSALLAEQCPDLAGLPVTFAASGWDNEMFRVGGHLAARLPRRAVAAPLLLNEQRWLPLLSKQLPLPIPAPVRFGRPGAQYPWGWSVIPWLAGTAADGHELHAGHAASLAAFLRALHVAAPKEAPRNPVRGCPLSDRSNAFEVRAARLAGQTGFSRQARDVWEEALAAPMQEAPTWIHGDLHPRNVLVDGDALSAVIDWGDLAAGDPATDLASIWMLLGDADDRRLAMLEYGQVSAAFWARARGWALLFAVIFMDSGFGVDRGFAAMGERTLQRVLKDP